MTCSACSSSIENHFNKILNKGIFEINISLLTNKLTVSYDPNELGPWFIMKEIEDIGF
jgi:copper chaperone CopZ